MAAFRERRQASHKPRADADVQVELTLLMFNKVAGTVVAGGICLSGTTALLARQFEDAVLVKVTLVTVLLLLLRLGVVLSFSRRRNPELTEIDAYRWEWAYFASTFIYCGTLAISTIYNFKYHFADARDLCTIGVFAYAILLSLRVGMRPWRVQACCILMMGSLAIALATSHNNLEKVTAAIVVMFVLLHCKAIENQHSVVVEQLRTRRSLRELASRDPLTGLANRRQFENSLEVSLSNRLTFAILFIDLDRFKQVNDTLGHRSGDLLLKSVADRLRSAVRDSDIVARLGGDEFAVLQIGVKSEEAASQLARRINQQLAAPFLLENEKVQIGASIGIRMSAADDNDPERMLHHADQALYRVKQAGGGSFSVA